MKMSWMELMFKIACGLALCSVFVGGCSYINSKLGVSDDHPVEELFEQHIEEHTGLDLDITPDSPE